MDSVLPLRDVIGNEIGWVQTGLSRVFNLVLNDRTYGRLSFNSVFGSISTAETFEGAFTLKRQGFLRPSISIRESGTDLDHGRMIMDSWHQGGVIHLLDGSQYHFIKKGFLHPEWVIIDGAGKPLVIIRAKWGLLRYQGELLFEPFGKEDRNIDLLVMIALYAIILMNEESAAVSATF